MTNRHYALRIKNAHSFSEPITSHAVTGQQIEGTYPNVDKAFPAEFKTEFSLHRTNIRDQIKDALHLLKIAWEIAKENDERKAIKLSLEPTGVIISVKHELVEFKALLGSYEGEEYFSNTFNSEYLLNAFQVFKDAGTTILRIRLNGRNEPMQLSDEENGIDVLLLPYRSTE